MSIARLRRIKEKLENALQDLHVLERAGVDTGYPQSLINEAIVLIDKETGDDKQNVFCSYRCNYWDMRGYLAEEMHLDIAEVEQYLSRRGYAHPDLIGGR